VQDPRDPQITQEIAGRLKEIRKKAGLSQARFAKELGVSQGNVATWETGASLPGALALRAINQKFDCSVDWMLNGDGPERIATEPIPQQKIEADFDPDLKDMMALLKRLMHDDDADLRGWTKIQFKNAFKDYLAMLEEEKKLHA